MMSLKKAFSLFHPLKQQQKIDDQNITFFYFSFFSGDKTIFLGHYRGGCKNLVSGCKSPFPEK